MSLSPNPPKAETPPWYSEQPIQSTSLLAAITSNQTTTATSSVAASAISALSITTNTIPNSASYVRVIVTADSISSSNASQTTSVTLACWVGAVGTGTQVGTDTSACGNNTKAGVDSIFYIPVTSTGTIQPGNSYTINIGMFGSAAGTNTLTAGATSQCYMTLEVL